MTKIALIDIDGVIADGSARFAKAEEAKAAYRRSAENTGNFIVGEDTKIYWRTAFTPDLVQLDTLIVGAARAIMLLEEAGYTIYYLTSRPEPMRDETHVWLNNHFVPCYADKIIMKPASQQFVKTFRWKAGVVEVLARLLNADDLLFVDDEEVNQTAIHALDICDKYIAGSLAEALAMIG